MITFLTSSPCSNGVPQDIHIPCTLNEANEFVSNLSKYWKPDSKCLIVSADPGSFERNDEMAQTFEAAFSFHGLSLSGMTICDERNEADADNLVQESDVVVLAGGHVPTQNAFFQKIGLKSLMRNYDGIVIGISAGTMNSAETVYAQPELEGESIDPDYQRFIPGLGLTDVMVLPHYQMVKDIVLDGKRLFEEITYPDSMGRKFYALVDGSYLCVQDGQTRVYGEAYLIADGQISQICEVGERIEI